MKGNATCLLFAVFMFVNTPGCQLIDYFSNAHTPGAPDATVRVVNGGIANQTQSQPQDLCAMIYIFDANQQMSECCGCFISANAELTFSVNNDLTANPLLGTKLHTGVITILASQPVQPCDPTNFSFTSGRLSGWATHIQNKVGSGFPVTEGESQTVSPGSGESNDLPEDCLVLRELGSGAGVCTCPPGH
jgi:hypothetical protein